MFDEPTEPSDDDEPIWDPSGWTPVFVGAQPGRPDARLIGHTRMRMPPLALEADVRRVLLTSPIPDDQPDVESDVYLHPEMVLHPYRRRRELIWAWCIRNERDREYIRDFRPLAN